MAPKKINKSTISAPVATTITATAYRFHLPALDIPTQSLTEGTQIPAPQREPSPPISPPQTPLSTDSPNPLRSHPTSSHSLSRKFSVDAATALRNGSEKSKISPPRTNESVVPGGNHSIKRAYTASPATSPQPPSKRPHIRKLLSLKSLASLNRSSADVSQTSPYDPTSYSVNIRSESPAPSTATSMSTFSRLKRRSSGAFWRKNSNSFGLGLVNEDNDQQMGGMEDRPMTPPPILPELQIDAVNEERNGRESVRRQASGFFGLDAKSISRIGRK